MGFAMKMRLPFPSALTRAAGFSLLEVMMALVVLGVAVLSLASVFGVAAGRTHSQSALSEDIVVCQSKMEELRTLSFTDTTTDTTTVPDGSSGTGLSVGGSTTSPTTGYVDYLDASAQHVASSSGAVYTRMWQITDLAPTGTNGNPTPAGLKQIGVRCTAAVGAGRTGLSPDTTLVTEISQ